MRPTASVSLVVRAVTLVAAIAGAAGCDAERSTTSTIAPTTPAPETLPAPTVPGLVPGRDAPPEAQLSAEGGDAVAGQLGSYAWRGTGSDGPWLPGAPIAVGAGEPLAVRLEPPSVIASWDARYVPAGAGGPAGAIRLGNGRGQPAFRAPAPGTWTVAVRVEFAGDVGSATYAWRLDVE